MRTVRFDDDALAMYLEVALTTVAPSLLGGLADADRRRRQLMIREIARQLVERLRFLDVRCEDAAAQNGAQPGLFPQDLGPIG